MADKQTKMSFADYALQFKKTRKNENILRQSSIIPHYERVKSIAPGIAYPTKGGLPHGGRIIEVSGLNSCGKTTGVSAIIADYQRNFKDKSILYVDVEQTYDIEHQTRMNHLDKNRLYVYNPDVGESDETILGTVLDMANQISDLSLIVIDSIPSLVPAIDYENEFEKDNGMRGTLAKYLYKWQRELLPIIKANDIDLILINQTRVKGKTFTGADILDEPCGDAVKFYASVRMRFGRRKFVDSEGEDLQNSPKNGTNPTTGEGASGFKLSFSFLKNKTSDTVRGGGFITYMYDGGMYITHDMFVIATKFNFINRLNNVTYEVLNPRTLELMYDEENKPLKGSKKDLYQYFKTHKDFCEEYTLMVNEKLSDDNSLSGNLLDESTVNEILEADTSVSSELSAKPYLSQEETKEE